MFQTCWVGDIRACRGSPPGLSFLRLPQYGKKLPPFRVCLEEAACFREKDSPVLRQAETMEFGGTALIPEVVIMRVHLHQKLICISDYNKYSGNNEEGLSIEGFGSFRISVSRVY